MLRAETTESLLESYKELALALGITIGDYKVRYGDIEMALKVYSDTIKSVFRRSKMYNFEWMVIIDNIFASNPLKEFLPLPGRGWSKGHVIVTTQDTKLALQKQTSAHTLSLSKGMDKDDAADLLCDIAGLEKDDCCAVVAQRLDYYPLSLACAAVFVQDICTKGLASNYSWKDCLETLEEFFELLKNSEFASLHISYPASMLSAAICSASHFVKNSSVFKIAFKFMSFCTIQPIPLDLVTDVVLENITEFISPDEVRWTLRTCPLLIYPPKSVQGIEVITMHQVVQTAFVVLRKESNKSVADAEGITIQMVDGRNFVEVLETLCQYYHRFHIPERHSQPTKVLLFPHLKGLIETGKKMNMTQNEAYVDGLVCLAYSLTHIALGTIDQRLQLLRDAKRIQKALPRILPDITKSKDDVIPGSKLEKPHEVPEKLDVKMSETTSVCSEKLVRHMPHDGLRHLSVLLGTVGGKNWKYLADKLGLTAEEIRNLETKDDPVMAILNDRRCLDLTIATLKSVLAEMERFDAIEDLEPFDAQTLTQSEYERKHEERARLTTEFENLTVLPDDVKYDAFISYPKKERPFAEEMLRKLEADPYHLKLCISYRDLLPGSHGLSAIVNVIEERCRKVVVLISKHFSEDIDADFQAKIALGLSPGCKQKRLIPIVMDDRKYVPAILKHITHLDYSNAAAREYFWPNLARALGYRD